MSSVPVWVWMNSAMFAGAGVYLWWRLVAQTTERGTIARRIGNVVLGLIIAAAPVALLGQFTMPIGFQRAVGWPAWIGYAFVIFAGCTALLVEPFRVYRWWRRRRRHRVAELVSLRSRTAIRAGFRRRRRSKKVRMKQIRAPGRSRNPVRQWSHGESRSNASWPAGSSRSGAR